MASLVVRVVQRLATGFWPMVGLFGLLLLSLFILSDFSVSYGRFGHLYIPLLLLNCVGLAFIAVLIGVNVANLVRQFREQAAGARLTARLVTTFIGLALVPVVIVFAFSVRFINSGIDAWVNIEIEQALDDALELSQGSLDLHTRTLRRTTERMAERLAEASGDEAMDLLTELDAGSTATELMLMTPDGEPIAISSGSTQVAPLRPTDGILMIVREGESHVALEPVRGAGLHVRAVVPVPAPADAPGPRALQALYPIPRDLDALAGNVQQAVGDYRELTYLRGPLKTSFIATLTLALGLSVLTAIWAAFLAARRLMQPVHNLAEGTRAVAAGDYTTRLPPSGRDELGFLVESFNEMTRRLAHERDQAHGSRLQVERQRAYLEAVLERLSTGVITLAGDGTLHTANEAAARILGLDLTAHSGRLLDEIAGEHAQLGQFLHMVMPRISQARADWHEEFELPGPQGRKIIVCRGARLSDQPEAPGGWVIVFDDITALVQAQREAAWSEVARRLAHEIKNPLTPIQLSTERLRQRFLERLESDDAEMLDRATWTIIQQVDALKGMVRTFADYAATPAADFSAVDLNALVREVADLYEGSSTQVLTLDLDSSLPAVEADRSRLRQVLHNLIKNALEAQEGRALRQVTVNTRAPEAGGGTVELRVADAGPGIPEEMLEGVFQPYMTGKPRGSGLGLAIVKKIIEEHGGTVAAENAAEGGAAVRVHLPVSDRSMHGSAA
jgi:PAS domain S-box-containing protein